MRSPVPLEFLAISEPKNRLKMVDTVTIMTTRSFSEPRRGVLCIHYAGLGDLPWESTGIVCGEVGRLVGEGSKGSVRPGLDDMSYLSTGESWGSSFCRG